jgi:hypothetical protein
MTLLRKGRGKATKSLELISAAYEILDEIQPATVRAVCYRLFVAGLIPSMAKSVTNGVGQQLVWAREQGLIPWDWIVDETREAERPSAWENAEEFLRVVQRSYRRDLWADQPEWIEVWAEKGTLRGTLWPVLDEYGITFRVMHGHASATVVRSAANETFVSGRRLTVLYVGDHDPSGLHMSEVDLPDRLDRYGGSVELVRVAILSEDMAELPTFLAKDSDTRSDWYVNRHGPVCCELDAMRPDVLRARIEDEIRARMDIDAWTHALSVEAVEQESMRSFLAGWKGISGQAWKYDGGAA